MSTLRVLLLGALEVYRGEDLFSQFISDKNQALLGYLAATAPTVHRRDTLAGLFWPEQSNAAARHSLSQALYLLRANLMDHTPGPAVMAQTQVVYWSGQDAWVDIAALDRILLDCDQHAHAQAWTCETCLERLEQAAALYRGEFWDGFSVDGCEAFEDWLRQMRASSRLKMVRIFHWLVSGYSQRKEFDKAIVYGQMQLSLDPYHEPGYLQLMQILAQSGRRAESAVVYENYRRMLDEELGLEPDETIRALYQSIQQPEVIVPLAADRSNLPELITPIVGRKAQIGAVCAQLKHPATRLLTILGMGGVGKTSLAMEAGRQLLPFYPDGVWMVNVGDLTSQDGMIPAIAEVLNLAAIPSAPGSIHWTQGGLTQQVLHYLRGKQLLLILDSFECRMDCVTQVTHLLSAGPGIKILATSRVPLALEGETLFHLEGLPFPESATKPGDIGSFDAVQLFVRTARRSNPGFRLRDEHAGAVAEICRVVQGMPLGILLAASWAHVLEPGQILAEIRTNRDFLSANLRNLPERQRSLQATFDYSLALLAEADRQAFTRLAIFAGSFSRSFAQQICGLDARTSKSLVDLSLLNRAGPNRYVLHDLLRQYAQEQLAQDAAASLALRQRFVTVYLQHMRQWFADLRSARQLQALSEMKLEQENALTAWNWALHTEDFSRLDHALDGLCQYFSIQNRFKEGLKLCEYAEVVLAERGMPPMARLGCRLKIWQGWFDHYLENNEHGLQIIEPVYQQLQSDSLAGSQDHNLLADACLVKGLNLMYAEKSQATELVARSLALMRQYGERWDVARTIAELAAMYNANGELRATYQLAWEGVETYRDLKNTEVLHRLHVQLLYSLLLYGDHQTALRILEELEQYDQKVGGSFAQVDRQLLRGACLYWVGQFAEAKVVLEDNLNLQKQLNWMVAYAFHEVLLANLIANQPAYSQALAIIEERMQTVPFYIPDYLLLKGSILLARKQYEQAKACFETISAGPHKLRNDFLAAAFSALGLIAYRQQEFQTAQSYLTQALAQHNRYPTFVVGAYCLAILGVILQEHSQPEQAGELFAAAVDHPFMQGYTIFWDIFGESMRAAGSALGAQGREKGIHQLVKEYSQLFTEQPNYLADCVQKPGGPQKPGRPQKHMAGLMRGNKRQGLV